MARLLFSREGGWRHVPVYGALIATLAAVWFCVIHYFTADRWVPFLDPVNLVIHEAGHPIIGIFSNHLNVYGGTIFQLLFPAMFGAYFLLSRDALGLAAAGIWVGESLMNVARYMEDARAQLLPLVGGGLHDWTEIFYRWGVLRNDVAIGGFTRTLGLLVMLAACAWMWRRSLTE